MEREKFNGRAMGGLSNFCLDGCPALLLIFYGPKPVTWTSLMSMRWGSIILPREVQHMAMSGSRIPLVEEGDSWAQSCAYHSF